MQSKYKTIVMEGAMMKSRFFPRKDEVVLSTMTAFVVIGLLHLGFASLTTNREHAMFQKNVGSGAKK